MVDDTQRTVGSQANDPLDGDLELESRDAEQIQGGAMIFCSACNHRHLQAAPKCNRYCIHGGGGSSGGGIY
jgi:hypothetical protein